MAAHVVEQDYFYVCPGHLKDRGFCSPIIDEAEATAKRKKEKLDREVELIKREYDEKTEKKKAKDKKSKEKEEEEAKQAEQEKNDKVSSQRRQERRTTAEDEV